METKASYVAVGAFVLAMIALAFGGVIYFAAVQPTARNSFYDIYFRGAVSGLNKGAEAEYNGIPVGKVSDVEIDPNNVEQIRVTVEIDNKVVIKDDAKAELQSNLLSGVSYILISRGTQEAKALVAKPGERYPVIASRRSALASVSARGPELMEKLNDIADNLNIVLNEQNRKALHDILDNVRMITADFAAHDKEFAGLGANANATLDSARETLGNLNTALAAVTKFVGHVDVSYTDADGLKDRLSRTLGDADEAAKEIRGTVHEARGTVKELNTHTLNEVNDLLREARLFVAGVARLAGEIERDPSRLLYGDRREGYRPK